MMRSLLHFAVTLLAAVTSAFPGVIIIGPFPDPPNPRKEEQLLMELINAARANPEAEAARLGIGLNDGLPPKTISFAPKPPIAPHDDLMESSRRHTYWMYNTGTLAKNESATSTPAYRALDRGYPVGKSYAVEESIARLVVPFSMGLEEATGMFYETLFRSPEDRKLMLDPDFDEMGAGLHILDGIFITPTKTLYCTVDYAHSDKSPAPPGPYIFGVVYNDKNSNGAYDVGEGLKAIKAAITPGRMERDTDEVGSYTIPRGTNSGKLIVTFTGLGLGVPVQIPVLAPPGKNVKVDLPIPAVTDATATRIIAMEGDLNFNTVQTGDSAMHGVTIRNYGNSPLRITEMRTTNPAFSGGFSTAVTIRPGESQLVYVFFHPTNAGEYSGDFQMISDATSGRSSLPAWGRGVSGNIAAKPQITPDGSAFEKRIQVTITCATPGAVIRYTTDGSLPTIKSKKYIRPLVLRRETTVKAIAFLPGSSESGTAVAHFYPF